MKTSIALTPTPLTGVPFLFAGRLDHGIARAAALGYDAVELHIRDPKAEDMPGILDRVRAAGLAVSSFGTGQGCTLDGLTIGALDGAVREAARRRLFAHVEAAAGTGATVIVGSMQGRLSAEPDVRARQQTEAEALLRSVAEAAGACGVRVAIEPLNRYETNFLNRVSDALAMVARVDRPALGVLLDTFHMNIEETDMAMAVEQAGHRIGMVHLADSNRGAPGLGHTDFVPIVAALRACGYTGFLSAEVMPRGDDEHAAAVGIATMRALLGVAAAVRGRAVRAGGQP